MFLLNVPSTWQTPQSRELYREELAAIGTVPRPARRPRADSPTDSSRSSSTTTTAANGRSATRARNSLPGNGPKRSSDCEATGPLGSRPTDGDSAGGIPPGPGRRTAAGRRRLFSGLVEEAGGRIVVDATETGERTLPAPSTAVVSGSTPRRTGSDLLRRDSRRVPPPQHAALRLARRRSFQLTRCAESSSADTPSATSGTPNCTACARWSGVPVLDIDVAASDDGQRSRTPGKNRGVSGDASMTDSPRPHHPRPVGLSAIRSSGRRAPRSRDYGGCLRRHVDDGDTRLLHLAMDNSAASLRLWNFLLTEEDRLHQARTQGKTIVGTLKDWAPCR